MKKVMILTVLILFVFTGLSLAAQKTVFTYMRAGDMGTSMPLVNEDFVSTGTPGAITGDFAHGNLSFGNDLKDSSGSYWYGGDSDIAYCVDGECAFGIGFRAYFEFTFPADTSVDSTGKADGFGFAIANGQYNSKISTGGAPAGISQGELMGYAGPGRSDGLGLRPPKMMVEFDTFPNTGTGDVCAASSRSDPNNNNHIALMLWGDTITGNCTISGTNYPKATFDDNRHGAGQGTASYPYNSTLGDGSGGYYAGAKNGSYNWLEDGVTHRFRIEVVRATAPVGGTYPYNVKAWVDCPGCDDGQKITFKDLHSAYTALTPQINRTVNVTAADHAAFNTFLFGFTEATGGSTQTTVLQNFDIFFPRTACRYGTNPTSASYDYSGSPSPSPTIDVRAGTGCPWQAISNKEWIHITSGTTGTANGTVTYTIDANPGAARTGAINIGDRIFTVTQEAVPLSVTSINPNTGNNDRVNFNVTITGTGFQSGATVTRFAGIGNTFRIDNVTFVNSTTITARFRIDTTVSTGANTIRVTNPDGQYADIGFTVY